MDNKKVNTKKLLVKVLVLFVIVVGVTVVWVIKNKSDLTPIDKVTGNVADFLLEASSIDMDSLKKHSLPIIIDFGADSCEPCKEMAPVLKTLNAEMQGKAIIKFVDVWKNSAAANDFPVQVIPTQIFFDADGKPYVPGEDIGIEFSMYSYSSTGEHAFTVHQGGLTESQMREILKDLGVRE